MRLVADGNYHIASMKGHGVWDDVGRGYASAISRRDFRPSDANSVSLFKVEGAGKAGCRLTPAVSCAKRTVIGAHEHTGSAETARLSPRNGFTAYFVLSPVSGLFCHRHLRIAPQA